MAKPAIGPANDDLYVTLLGSALDGRGRTARYRQNQLHFLHHFLRLNADAIRSAICQDGSATKVETETEFGMALAAVRKLYDQINFQQSLKDEFQIARHKDNLEARVPYGIILVRPALHTRFFSIITAVATALAAGNVVLLELEESQLSIDAFFRTDFETYDGETLAIATSRVEDDAFLNKCLLVDQRSTGFGGANILAHPTTGSVVAVLDRTADVSAAARAITRSKFYFRGSSPYGIDTVLVNEWVKKEFIAQCREVIKNESESLMRAKRSQTPQQTKSLDRNLETLLDIDEFVVSEVHPGAETLLQKSSALHIKLVTVSGLVDTMTVASNMGPLSAVFCFSDDHQAKYLGQNIDCQLFVVNQIPISLLGPNLPVSSVVPDLDIRYDTSMMSKPAPQFISDLDRALKALSQEGKLPLKPIKQGSGFDIGFFDRGAILGSLTILLPCLGLLVYSGSQAAMYGYRWCVN